MEVHVYAHDQCQARLSMGWLVCACITIFHEVLTIFFLQFSVGQIHFGRCILAPCRAHQCFELQYLKKGRKNIAISIRISTDAAKVVIFLVKLRFFFPLLQAIHCPRLETGSDKKRQSNRE